MDPLSIIASVISIIGAITSSYSTIKKVSNLPGAFDKVQDDLAMVSKLLDNAKTKLAGIQMDADERNSLAAIASRCEKKIYEMQEIFETLKKKCLENPGGETWTKLRVWYREAIKGVKSQRIENLMTDLLKDVKLLVMSQMACLATTKDLDDIKVAIDGLLNVEPSLEDHELEGIGAIHASQSISDQASGTQWNMQGVHSTGNVSFGGTINQGGVHNSGGTHTHLNGENKLATEPELALHHMNSDTIPQDSNQDVFTWLSKLSFSATYESRLNDWKEGTGQWFFETNLFQRWLQGEHKTLWCQGHAGVGKTIMMSIVIHHLEKKKAANEAIVYTYLDHNDSVGAERLIASLVRQLAEQNCLLSNSLLESYKRHKNLDAPLLRRECQELLLSEADRFQRVYMVIDGLDERRDEAMFGLLSAVNVLLSSHSAASLLVSSRKIESIASCLEDPVIYDLEARHSDINVYIDQTLASDLPILSRRVRKYPGLLDLIKKKLNEKAKGMFLLPKLHLQILERSKCRNRKAYEQLLSDLPSPLDQTYELLWNRIQDQDNEDAELARDIMTWLCCSLEALSFQSFSHALIWQSTGHECQVVEEDLIDEEQLADVCLGLIVINKDKDIVGFSHYTAEDYFKRTFPSAEGHQRVASACIRCLSTTQVNQAENFSSQPDSTSNTPPMSRIRLDTLTYILSPPLFSYASRNWGLHAKNAVELSMLPDILRFFDLPERVTASGRALALSNDQSFLYDSSAPLPDKIQGIHLAAFFGLLDVMKNIIEAEQGSADAVDTRGWSVLRWACFGKQTETVKFLLHRGANVDFQDIVGDTTLIWALGNRRTVNIFNGVHFTNTRHHFGHMAFVQGLKSVNPTLPGEPQPFNCTPETIKDLIQYSKHLDTRGYLGRTALSHAAENQQFDVVEQLLERAVNIECEDDDGMTPLLWSLQAPRWSYEFIDCIFFNSIVHIGDFIVVDLMRNGGDNDSPSGKPAARDIVQEDIALKLIGTHIDAIDFSGLSALHLAAERRHSRLVDRLIGLKADVNMISGGLTPLDRASRPFHRYDFKMSNCGFMNTSTVSEGPCMQIHWSEEKGLKSVELVQFYKSQSRICDKLRQTGAKTSVTENTDAHCHKDPMHAASVSLNNVQEVMEFAISIQPQAYLRLNENNHTSKGCSTSFGDRCYVISQPIDLRTLNSSDILLEGLSDSIDCIFEQTSGFRVLG